VFEKPSQNPAIAAMDRSPIRQLGLLDRPLLGIKSIDRVNGGGPVSGNIEEQFYKLCALTVGAITESKLDEIHKQFLIEKFLLKAKAAADDKSCDILKVTALAADEILAMVRSGNTTR
jgi:hypothetical protein